MAASCRVVMTAQVADFTRMPRLVHLTDPPAIGRVKNPLDRALLGLDPRRPGVQVAGASELVRLSAVASVRRSYEAFRSPLTRGELASFDILPAMFDQDSNVTRRFR